MPRIEALYFADLDLRISAASAQAYFSTVASGMMAMTGVTFAMAFVAVQFGSVAYSPRLALWMGRDRTIFHALGVFTATFTYSLFALAWIDRQGTEKVPAISSIIVALALIASLLCFSALVQGINTLQITNVLAFVGDKGRETIENMFLQRRPESPHFPGRVDRLADGAPSRVLVYAGAPKSVCRINIGLLMRLARDASGMIVVTCAVGDTLVLDTPVLRIYGSSEGIPDRRLLRAFDLQAERTFEQDPKYALRLLADIAIKALSPAINDPTTAVQTIDQLEDLLNRIQRRRLDSGEIRDTDGTLRVVFPVPTWEDYVNLAFEEIRQYGADSIQVMRRLRSALNALLSAAQDPEMQTILRRFLTDLDISIDRSFDDPSEKLLAKQEDRQGLGGAHRSAQDINKGPMS